MELPAYHFTFLVSPISPDFFETHTTSDDVSRALDSRYWETRMTSSAGLFNSTCTSTLDIEKVE